ncbi:MAG: class I adenylate-forming enzyme family protein [Myxococcota bacterium]
MPSLQEIESQLLQPGSPFEVTREEVLGAPVSVFARRRPSLRALLEGSAAHAEREYMVYGDRRIRYGEHLRGVASVARALRDEYGVGPGDRVAILAANCPEWIATFWATVAMGAIAVGLNGWWARDEILFGLEDAEPRLLVGDRKRLARLDGCPIPVPVVEIESAYDALWKHDPVAELPDAPIAEDDPATILYTSGTTGRPKGAINTHRNIVAITALQFFHGARVAMAGAGHPDAAPPPPINKALVTTPLFHVSGLYTGAVTSLVAGGTTVWMPGRFDPVRVMETIEREGITSWGPMGTMAHRVVNHPDVSRYDLSSLRTLGSGGAPLSAELQEQMREAFPNARRSLGLGYGLTECTGLATITFGDELEAHPHTVGAPLPTVDVEIRDADGKALADGAEGEIHVRSPLVMRGYWRRPEATAESIGPGRWLRTGDWGHVEGGRLYLHSRKRDLILRGAENIHPVEIEQRLEAHPDVREAAVVGIDHPELGQEVKAIVVMEPGATLDPEVLARWVADALAYFKVPAHWQQRSRPMPRNATGKVMKHLLEADAESPFVEE